MLSRSRAPAAGAALQASGASPIIAFNPGGSVVVTNSTSSYSSGFVDTPVASRVDQYQTTLTATLGSGQQVYQQTFNLPFTDPAVQAAVTQAGAVLKKDGATFGSPAQTSSSTTLSGTQVTY